MCAIVVWLVNSSVFGDEFLRFTEQHLDTVPEPADLRVKHASVRENTVAFTLIRNMCDCSAVIGTDELLVLTG